MSIVTQRMELPPLPFRKYRAIPQPVTAVQLQQPEDVPNPFGTEGFYHGEPGDWKICYGQRADGSKDVSICAADIFAQNYEHLGGDQYQKKANVVIEAAKLDSPLDIVTLEGPAHGDAGEWLLLGVKDEPYFTDDAYFCTHYTLVD